MTLPDLMTEYPETRTVRWVDDNGNDVGKCEYIRKDIADELARALEMAMHDLGGLANPHINDVGRNAIALYERYQASTQGTDK